MLLQILADLGRLLFAPVPSPRCAQDACAALMTFSGVNLSLDFWVWRCTAGLARTPRGGEAEGSALSEASGSLRKPIYSLSVQHP